MVSFADLPAHHCGGGHTTDHADIAGMKTEQDFRPIAHVLAEAVPGYSNCNAT